MITQSFLYQFKHGLAAHKDIEEALSLCSRMFRYQGLLLNYETVILILIGWLQQLNQRHGPAICFSKERNKLFSQKSCHLGCLLVRGCINHRPHISENYNTSVSIFCTQYFHYIHTKHLKQSSYKDKVKWNSRVMTITCRYLTLRTTLCKFHTIRIHAISPPLI